MVAKLIYRLFKDSLLKEFYKDQSFKRSLPKMVRVFLDSKGQEYYSFSDKLDMPISRWKEIEVRIEKLRYNLTTEDINLFADAMDKAIDTAVDTGKRSEMAKVKALTNELRRRQDILINQDVMFDLVALSYIRKDENPAEVDEVIHKEKIEQFKLDSKGGLYDFFYSAGLTNYMPYLPELQKDFNDLAMRAEAELKASEIWMKTYITGGKSLKDTSKTENNISG